MTLELPHSTLVKVVLRILIYRERLDSHEIHVVLSGRQLRPQEFQSRYLLFFSLISSSFMPGF
jgi:hypothetical protein